MRKALLIGLLAVAAACVWSPASARGGMNVIQFGLKAGVQTQGIRMLKNRDIGLFTAENDFGYQFGLTSRITFTSFFLQPEIVYSSHKFTLLGEGDNSVKTTVNNFEVPVLFGIKALFLRFYAGPVFTISNNTRNKLVREAPRAINTEFYKSTVAFQLGAGVEFGSFNIDLRYGGQFKRPVQYITIGEGMSHTVKTRMNQWQLNIGYFF